MPFCFVCVHGTGGGVAALVTFALWSLAAFAAYLDRADNHGRLFYNKLVEPLVQAVPCMRREGRSARARVGRDASFKLQGLPSSAGDGIGPADGADSVDVKAESRDFGQLSLHRKKAKTKSADVEECLTPRDTDEERRSPSLFLDEQDDPESVDALAQPEVVDPSPREVKSVYSHPLERISSWPDKGGQSHGAQLRRLGSRGGGLLASENKQAQVMPEPEPEPVPQPQPEPEPEPEAEPVLEFDLFDQLATDTADTAFGGKTSKGDDI